MTEARSLDDLIEIARQHARKVMIGTDKALTPAWVLIGPDRKRVLGVVGALWADQHEKEAMVAKVREFMREHGVTAYSFVCESWISKRSVPAGTPLPSQLPEGVPPPSQDPNRIEVVSAFASDGVATKFAVWSIRRDKRGRCTALPLHNDGDGSHMLSWFADLLSAGHA